MTPGGGISRWERLSESQHVFPGDSDGPACLPGLHLFPQPPPPARGSSAARETAWSLVRAPTSARERRRLPSPPPALLLGGACRQPPRQSLTARALRASPLLRRQVNSPVAFSTPRAGRGRGSGALGGGGGAAEPESASLGPWDRGPTLAVRRGGGFPAGAWRVWPAPGCALVFGWRRLVLLFWLGLGVRGAAGRAPGAGWLCAARSDLPHAGPRPEGPKVRGSGGDRPARARLGNPRRAASGSGGSRRSRPPASWPPS